MRLTLAGLPFGVGPDAALTEAERAALARRGSNGSSGTTGCFELTLVDSPLWDRRGISPSPPRGQPARVQALAGRIRVDHETFMAELDPARQRGWIFRPGGATGAVEISLRVALNACLPGAGGVPLHAAGVITAGRGVVFFGPSGAGKTTIASMCPWRVLSDELVAVVGSPFQLRETGFWGELGDREQTSGSAELAALVELAQGPGTRLERLTPTAALRRLLNVVLVPAQTGVWTTALGVLGRLVATTPVFRITWSPSQPPWSEIEAALGSMTTAVPGGAVDAGS